MDFEKRLDSLLWNYGVPPQLTGKRYLIYILKQIHHGSEITPTLLIETAQEFGKTRSAVYSALDIVRKKIINQCRATGEPYPRMHRNSFYEFLYWFYQRATSD